MKLLRVIGKNFKLLIRAKASAFIVLLGPLLVILLVGLVFSSKSTYELSLGYYTPSSNNLTSAFIDSLKQSKYSIQEFKDEESCVKKIEQGVIHTCIVFPPDFKITNTQSTELRFLVDYSRMNLVYKVIESVSNVLDIESNELSYSMTQILISRINSTIRDLRQDALVVEGLSPKLSLLASDLQKIQSNSESMVFEMGTVSLEDLRDDLGSLNQTYNELQDKVIDLINSSEDWIDELGDHTNVSVVREQFEDLKKDILDLQNLTPEKINQLNTSIKVLADSLSKLQSDLNTSKQLNKDTQGKINSAKNNLASAQSSLLDLKKSFDKTRQGLESITITSAETIVSPVNTKIEPIMLESSKLTFTFPFLLVLVIMFIALLLSSTLIIFEKNSKAVFRNHITPTKQQFFVITTFLTSFIVIVVQTIIILGLANYFMHIPLFKNALCTFILIFLTAAFFTVLGMAVGNFFTTQEGAIMASIVLGSIFMFLSNLVIPLESLAPALGSIIRYNPYVLASDLLRKSLLFNTTILEEYVTLLILGGAALAIFLLIIIFTGMKNKKRVKPVKEQAVLTEIQGEREIMAEKKPDFRLGDRVATNVEELFKMVSDMTKAEFEDCVTMQDNKIADWAEKSLGDRKLGSRLRKAVSRKDLLKALEDEARLEEKKEKEEQQ